MRSRFLLISKCYGILLTTLLFFLLKEILILCRTRTFQATTFEYAIKTYTLSTMSETSIKTPILCTVFIVVLLFFYNRY